MKLRWYTTYDKYGVDTGPTLQYRENEDDEWEDVEDVREREKHDENTDGRG